MATLIVTPSSLTLEVGKTQQLQTTPPGGAKWSSDNPAIATVSGSGLVTGVAEGNTVINARKGCSDGHPSVPVAVRIIPAEVIIDPPPEPGEPLAELDASDLTFLGQQFVDLNYANLAFCIRYVGDERRFLFYQFDGWQPNSVGDLVEYRENPAGWKNGEENWEYGNVPELQLVRRWKNWHTRQRMIDMNLPNAANIFGGNGAWPASFFFHNGKLWYTWQPQYPGGAIQWAAYSAVTLVDSEAVVAGDPSTDGNVVSDANIHGPYFFHDANVHDDWAQAACQLIPIPAERQQEMQAKFLACGHHKANVGATGPRGIGFWSIKDLPTTMPAPGSTLWPGNDAILLYDTSPGTGAQPVPNMRLPNVQFQAAGHASQGSQFGLSVGNAPPNKVGVPIEVSTEVGTCIYQKDYGSLDCISITMEEPASGGEFVPEIFNGAAWVIPPEAAVSHGAADLSGTENVFYWKQTGMTDTDPDGNGPLEYGTWIRLRRTVEGTTPGIIRAVVTTTGLITGNEYGDRPAGKGGGATIGNELYDAEHYAHAYEEIAWGGAWVRTETVEGLLYFLPMQTGGLWYGGAPAYMQPVGGGVPVKREYYDAVENWSNGGKSEGPRYPYFMSFCSNQIIELAYGQRERNGNGFQPQSFARVPDQWPGVIYPTGVNNPNSLYPGYPSYNVYGYGSSVQFDPKTSEVFAWFSNASVWSAKPILLKFHVR